MTTTFADELRQWGPEAPVAGPLPVSAAEAYCRTLATTHYENFTLVSWMLPRNLHQHFYNIYAYCRWSDDLADEIGDPGRSLELLAWWKEELAACYAGSARHPVFVALKLTIDEFQVPPKPFLDLLSAFEQDQRVGEYATFDDLLDYCNRSANPVGRLVLSLCRQNTEQNVAWSDSICTGLQLANFWQDVSNDFDRGRVYLPREDRERFGYSAEDLQDRVTNAAFLDLMRFEVALAREFLRGGLPLVEQLPPRLQVDIELFARGGLKILDRIERIDYRVWDVRPVVTKGDFARMFVTCVGRMLSRRFR